MIDKILQHTVQGVQSRNGIFEGQDGQPNLVYNSLERHHRIQDAWPIDFQTIFHKNNYHRPQKPPTEHVPKISSRFSVTQLCNKSSFIK